jgi:hypothetical protein
MTLPPDAVTAWLLDGDISVQYAVHRDLFHAERPDLRARIATEGWGRRFLDARGDHGHWGRAFYSPKWTSSHYTLLDLRHLELPRGVPEVDDTLARILTDHRLADGGIGCRPDGRASDVCVNGMLLDYACFFGVEPELLHSVVDFVLSEQLPDGGFNCYSNSTHPRWGHPSHSSVHSTLSVAEGFLQYVQQGYRYRAEDVEQAGHHAREFLLQHRLFRSHRTGEVISPRFLMLSWPHRWFFNVLRALDHFRAADALADPRLADGLAVLRKKQRKDGTWPVQARHSGETHFELETIGSASRVNTLRALRVLQAVDDRV